MITTMKDLSGGKSGALRMNKQEKKPQRLQQSDIKLKNSGGEQKGAEETREDLMKIISASTTSIPTMKRRQHDVEVLVGKERKLGQNNKRGEIIKHAAGAIKRQQLRQLRPDYFPQTAIARLLLLAVLAGVILALSSSSSNKKSKFQVEAIKLQPEGKEKFYWSGEQFVITCQNNNNIKNVKIRWIGPNGVDITEDRSQRVHAESTGPHGHRLAVMNATAADNGQYKCTLGSTDDRTPRQHIEFDLKVYKTTSFRDTARHLVLPAGQAGTLSCRVEFEPTIELNSVTWVRNSKPIEMYNDSSFSISEYDPVKQLSQLTINPVTKQHDGVYVCRAVAVTAQLSKISDHDIHLEVTYAPTFENQSREQTVWVERGQSVANRHQMQHLHHMQQQPGNVYGAPRLATHQNSRAWHNKQHHQASRQSASGGELAPATEGGAQVEAMNGSAPQVVRVELRCSCLANPSASILWNTPNSRYVLSKGSPPHILEEPEVKIEGHNTTSTLIVGYNLDPAWPFKADSYICSASNPLGKATMKFTIEQGDLPPAFNVGPYKQYNPQNSMLEFTLLGPNFDPESLQQQQKQHISGADITPPVDSFRIRAENSASSASKLWSFPQPQQHFRKAQNLTISLDKLPSGDQKLYLEAHNAVGWSPNATYLGVYYIVSSSSHLFPYLSNYIIIMVTLFVGVRYSTIP